VLVEEVLEGALAAVRRVSREAGATLPIVDGATVTDDVATSPLHLRRCAQQLQAQSVVLGATTALLTGHTRGELGLLRAHVDGVLLLGNDRARVRHMRQTVGNGTLLRHIELRFSLHRVIAVLKARQMGTDLAIREFVIFDGGINVSQPFAGTTGLLTGRSIRDEL
jgi:KaiC/GvpD/RAD55 family RecA-like ATPase